MTGQELLETALDICGLRTVDGSISGDTSDLLQRAVSLINITLAENAVLDCRIRKTEHKLTKIQALDEVIDCSDIVAYSVLPYGLARLFMLGEDDGLAADINKLYNEARTTALTFGKAKADAITEVYE